MNINLFWNRNHLSFYRFKILRCVSLLVFSVIYFLLNFLSTQRLKALFNDGHYCSKQPLFLIWEEYPSFLLPLLFALNSSQVQGQDLIQFKPIIMTIVMGVGTKLSLSNQDKPLDLCWAIWDDNYILVGSRHVPRSHMGLFVCHRERTPGKRSQNLERETRSRTHHLSPFIMLSALFHYQ